MRILLVNEARCGAGGVETYLSTMTRVLEQRGHDVALLYANPARETGPTAIPANAAWSVADGTLASALDTAARWQPDVAFSHNLRQLEIDDAIAARWPVVKMMHGYFGTCVSHQKTMAFPSVRPCTRTCGPACLIHYLPRRCGSLRPSVMIDQYAWTRRQQALFDRYRRVIVASEHMRDEYARHGIDPGRLHVVPLFGQPPIAMTQAGSFDVLFLGRMTPLKGADVLVIACAHAARLLGRDVSLVAAGTGPLLEKLQRPPAGVRVETPGWVDERSRADLLARATVVAVPSRWPEPFGLVGLEAAACGAPAVAFDAGGISTWLRHRDNGLLVDPATGARGFGAALATVLGSPKMRATLAAGALAAAERFSVDAHAAGLEHVLQDAIGAAAPEVVDR